jgi:hypothetical protein
MMLQSKKIGQVRGTILLVALVVMAMGTLGMTAWVSLLHARMGQVDAIEDAAIRRVTLENSRAVAREHVFKKVVTESSGAAQTISLPGGWGSFTVPAWSGTSLNANTVGDFNQFSPSTGATYETSHALTLSDGISNLPHSFNVRSHVPMFHGDVFTYHRPTISPSASNRLTGNINVYGRAVLWSDLSSGNPGDYNDLDAQRFVRPDDGVTNFSVADPSSGAAVLPDNYPMVASTNGEVGSAAAYDGRINIVSAGTVNAENSLMAKAEANSPIYVDGSTYRAWSGGVHCNGSGRVYIELDTASLRSVIVSNVFRIYLYGQSNSVEEATAGAMNPVILVHTRSSPTERALYSIRCFDRNSRKLVMGVKKSYESVETNVYFYDSFDNPTWRMILAAENTRLRTINLWGGAVNFKGGIQTDRSIRHTGWYSYAGAFNIVPEDEPELLIPLMSRNAWLESYAQ